MDPVSAFGLAAGVAQFIGFAASLISSSVEIHTSVSGATSEILNIEMVYQQLAELSTLLAGDIVPHPGSQLPSPLTKHVGLLIDIAKTCKGDCDKLLAIVRTLKTGSGSKGRNKWRSFRTALKTVWKANEIDSLEHNLRRGQQTLQLAVTSISTYVYSLIRITSLSSFQGPNKV